MVHTDIAMDVCSRSSTVGGLGINEIAESLLSVKLKYVRPEFFPN